MTHSAKPRRARAAVSTAVAAAAVAVAAMLAAPPPASAQRWVNPDVVALRDEVAAMRRQLSALQGGGGAAGGGAPALSGDDFVRLDQIAAELRRLTGAVEQLQFQQRQAEIARESAISELRFRIEALEGGGVADLSQAPQSGLGRAPQAGGGFAGAIGEGGAPIGESGFSGSAPQPRVGESAALGPGRGAPPSILGSVPAQQDPGAPQIDRPRFEGSTVGAVSGAGAGFGAAGGASVGAAPTARLDPDVAFQGALDKLRAGSFDEAERAFQGFIDTNPNDARVGDATYWLGETYYVRARYDRAARLFLDGFRNYPQSSKAPDSLLKLGMTLAQLGQSEEACATLSEVSARYPDAAQTVLRRAQLEQRRAGCS